MLKVSENPLSRWPADRPLSQDLGRWSVACVKPRNEKALARELERLEVSYYLPMVKKITLRRDTGKPRKSVICAFPGYVPVVDYRQRKEDILRTGRIFNIISVSDQERFVSELENVRRALDGRLEANIRDELAVGKRAVVISGPLEGVEGVICDMDNPGKISLNVDMFKRAIIITVSPDLLALYG